MRILCANTRNHLSNGNIGYINMPIKLSYIVPAYNADSYIQKTLDGIFELPLTREELEVIVIDDCSTDNTWAVLKNIQKAHPNLIVFHQETNQRQGAARNKGIEIARGKYIAFCDADDTIVADGVMNALRAVEKSHVDICYFDFEYEKSDGKWQFFEMPDKTRNTTLSASDYLNNYYTCYYNAPWRNLYRTEFLRQTQIRFVERVRWEDCDWTVKVYAKTKEIQFVEGVGYRYAWNESATTKQTDPRAMVEQLMAGIRLTTFAVEIKTSLPGLSKVLSDEAKYRYVIQNIRLRNLTKYRVSDMHYLYKKISASDWNVIETLSLPMWESIVAQYHALTFIILCVACPLAAIGRKVVELKRKI